MKRQKGSLFVDLVGINGPRKRFISAVNDLAPGVCSDFADCVFPFYRENLSILEPDGGTFPLERLTVVPILTRAINEWAAGHHLPYQGRIPHWLDLCVKITLRSWIADRRRHHRLELLIPKNDDAEMFLTAELRS